MRSIIRPVAGVLFLATLGAAPPPYTRTSPLVGTREGRLPIILSAPHGGTKAIPGVPPRKGEGLVKGSTGFFTGRDTGTEELAADVAEAVEKRMGHKPFVVVARFHRRYIDANRPPEIGLESPLARPVYDVYHRTLGHYCRQVKTTYGRGLLLDLHGQGTARDTIFRGTQNGQTVTLLRERFGEKAHTGPKSFFGLLAANGCRVFPADGTGKEQAGFTGGHIVRTYGSHAGYGIDAIQLEFGGDYREAARRKATAAKVAAAVEAYARLYLELNPAKR